MHELYIAQSIIKTVQKSLPEKYSGDAVTQVRMQVGQLDAVIPETLQFLFDAIKGDSGLPQAELVIEQIDVACRCRACSREFTMDLPIFICPHCQSGDVELLRGRGITLTGISVNDNEEA